MIFSITWRVALLVVQMTILLVYANDSYDFVYRAF